MNKDVKRILGTARKVLLATGWKQGGPGKVEIKTVDGDGPHCLLGALAAAAHIEGLDEGLVNHRGFDIYLEWEKTTRTGPYPKAIVAVARRIRPSTSETDAGRLTSEIWGYNDGPLRRVDDVLAVLEVS